MVLEMRGRAQPATLLLVALVLSGMLAMHGFEALLIHPDHWSSTGHRADIPASAAEVHVSPGGCDIDGAKAAPVPGGAVCTVGTVGGLQPAARLVDAVLPVLANRGVLTAFSILRI